jgi:hypothetical protein
MSRRRRGRHTSSRTGTRDGERCTHRRELCPCLAPAPPTLEMATAGWWFLAARKSSRSGRRVHRNDRILTEQRLASVRWTAGRSPDERRPKGGSRAVLRRRTPAARAATDPFNLRGSPSILRFPPRHIRICQVRPHVTLDDAGKAPIRRSSQNGTGGGRRDEES